MNSADSLNIGGNIQGADEDTPRKVDTFMQVILVFVSLCRISAKGNSSEFDK